MIITIIIIHWQKIQIKDTFIFVVLISKIYNNDVCSSDPLRISIRIIKIMNNIKNIERIKMYISRSTKIMNYLVFKSCYNLL